MTDRAYVGGVLNQVWHQDMSELLDKQVNAQKERKTSGVHASFRKPTKKCAMK